MSSASGCRCAHAHASSEEVVSIVTVVKKNGYAAIASDSLASYGSLKMSTAYSRTNQKIVKVGHSYIGMVGYAVSMQVLEHVFKVIGDPPALATTGEIFDVFMSIHPRLKQDYFLVPRVDPGDAFEQSQMHALIANAHGIFSVGSMRTVTEHERFWASGSGIEYALGAMHAVYGATNDVVAIAEAGVRAAVEFDNGCGLPVVSYLIALLPQEAEDFDLLLKA